VSFSSADIQARRFGESGNRLGWRNHEVAEQVDPRIRTRPVNSVSPIWPGGLEIRYPAALAFLAQVKSAQRTNRSLPSRP
jgi:hypothetical protein